MMIIIDHHHHDVIRIIIDRHSHDICSVLSGERGDRRNRSLAWIRHFSTSVTFYIIMIVLLMVVIVIIIPKCFPVVLASLLSSLAEEYIVAPSMEWRCR